MKIQECHILIQHRPTFVAGVDRAPWYYNLITIRSTKILKLRSSRISDRRNVPKWITRRSVQVPQFAKRNFVIGLILEGNVLSISLVSTIASVFTTANNNPAFSGVFRTGRSNSESSQSVCFGISESCKFNSFLELHRYEDVVTRQNPSQLSIFTMRTLLKFPANIENQSKWNSHSYYMATQLYS